MRRAMSVALLLAASCGDELTAATSSEDAASSSETDAPSSESDSETSESGDGDGDSDTTDGETETGETGEELDPDAQDACPNRGCLCLTEPTTIDRAPELHGALVDLNGDGWLDEVYFSNQGWPIVFLDGHLFSARMGTGEGTFEDEGTYGPFVPERFFVVTDVAVDDFDGDGAPDLVVNEDGLVYVPNAELFEDVLIEHVSPLLGYVPAMTTGTLPGESRASVFVTYSYYNLVEVLSLDPDTQTFVSRQILATDLEPKDLVYVDLDDDGDGDLVTADVAAEGVSVFLWDAGQFGPPQRRSIPDVQSLVALPARGLVVASTKSSLYDVWASDGQALVQLSGELPGYTHEGLAAVDGGDAMIWERYVPLDGSPPSSLEFLYAVCATGDHSWTLGELPLWAGGERYRLADWVVRDVDGQLGQDLSIRSYETVDGEIVRHESRMTRQ